MGETTQAEVNEKIHKTLAGMINGSVIQQQSIESLNKALRLAQETFLAVAEAGEIMGGIVKKLETRINVLESSVENLEQRVSEAG